MKNSLQTCPDIRYSVRETDKSYIVQAEQEQYVTNKKISVFIPWSAVIVMVALCVAFGFYRPVVIAERENVAEPTEVSCVEMDWHESGMLFPESSERRLDESDIQKLAQIDGHTEKELIRFAINEIYARHHYLFTNEKYLDFYSGYEWYDGYLGAEAAAASFSKTEHKNIALLLKAEEQCKRK